MVGRERLVGSKMLKNLNEKWLMRQANSTISHTPSVPKKDNL